MHHAGWLNGWWRLCLALGLAALAQATSATAPWAGTGPHAGAVALNGAQIVCRADADRLERFVYDDLAADFGRVGLTASVGVTPGHDPRHPAPLQIWFGRAGHHPAIDVPAARYGIVMGSSHAEPLLRNNVAEWSAPPGLYNYATHPEAVRAHRADLRLKALTARHNAGRWAGILAEEPADAQWPRFRLRRPDLPALAPEQLAALRGQALADLARAAADIGTAGRPSCAARRPTCCSMVPSCTRGPARADLPRSLR